MPGFRKTSRRSNKDNKNQTRVRKQKKSRTQRQNKRQKRTLKGGSNMLNTLKGELHDATLMANKSTQGLSGNLSTLGLKEGEIAEVLESINKILEKNGSLSNKIEDVKQIIKDTQEKYGI